MIKTALQNILKDNHIAKIWCFAQNSWLKN